MVHNGTTLTAGLTEDNFLGKGQKVKVSSRLASTQSLYDLSITEPILAIKIYQLGDLYSRFDDPTNVKYETET